MARNGRRALPPSPPSSGFAPGRGAALPPGPRRGDRYGVLTEEVLETIAGLMEKNPERKRVYTLLGVDKSTFRRWYVKGRALEPGDPSPFRRLFEIIERADLLFERRCLDEIIEAARGVEETVEIDGPDGHTTKKTRRSGDWKAVAWLLEKRFPKKYGQKRKIELEGKITLEAALSAIAHGEDPKALEGPK